MKEITERLKKYLDLIIKHQGEFKWAGKVADILDVKENTVRVQLKRLIDLGFLKKEGVEKYSQLIPNDELVVLSMSFVARQKQVQEKKETKKVEKEKVKEVKSRKSETIRISSYRIVTPSHLQPLEYTNGKLSKIPIPLYLSA